MNPEASSFSLHRHVCAQCICHYIQDKGFAVIRHGIGKQIKYGPSIEPFLAQYIDWEGLEQLKELTVVAIHVFAHKKSRDLFVLAPRNRSMLYASMV